MNDMSGEITYNILDYLLGGKCSFTLVQDPINGQKGGIKRYFISESNGFYFVYSLSEGKRYLGFFRNEDLGNLYKLRVGKKPTEGTELDSKPLVVVLNSLQNKGKLPGNGIVHIISDGRCSVCGRKLTDLGSIHYGMGPTCRAKRGLG